jgi:hypothetical protein
VRLLGIGGLFPSFAVHETAVSVAETTDFP